MLLDSRKVVKAKDIANVLEASERTIYRDIDILSEAGVPIISISGPLGGFSFMEGYKLNSDSLHHRDIVNILISSMGIKVEKNTETYQEFKNAIIKLENSVPEEYREEIFKARKKILCDSDPWLGEQAENNNIDIIKNAVFNLKKLKITYKKYKGQASERIVRPYGVIVKDSELYFSAFCEERKGVRIFKCSRIQALEILSESFNMPEKFSLEEFWESSKQQFIRRLPSHITFNKAYSVKIKIFEEKRTVLQGFEVLHHEKCEGYHIYDINMISFQTACSVIFPLSDKIAIIEPKELKKYIIDKAKEILNINKE
jgi:predicted DNA-binding transcriptional regulator YafY